MEIVNNCLYCNKKLRKLNYLKNGKWGNDVTGKSRKYHKSCWNTREAGRIIDNQLQEIYNKCKNN